MKAVGVSQMKANGKWQAYIMVEKKRKHLGLFDTQEEAIEARKQADIEAAEAIELHFKPGVSIHRVKDGWEIRGNGPLRLVPDYYEALNTALVRPIERPSEP